MKSDLLKIIVCPDCRGKLEPAGLESEGKIINEGSLSCMECGVSFPIKNGIPNLIALSANPEKSDMDHTTAGVNRANQEYHDKHATTYETDRHTNYMFFGACQDRIESVVKWAASRTKGGSSLDMGCGTGNVLKFEAEHFDQAVGIDISDRMMRLIPIPQPDVMLAAVTASPFEDESFDFVSSFSVLHHLFDPSDAVREAYRVLKPGGIFYSDWDFNDRFRTRLFFSLWLHEFNPISAFKGFMDHFLLKDEENEIFTMAEYHAFKDWMDAEEFSRAAREIGFSKVHLIYHWNAPSIIDDGGEPFQPEPEGIIPIATFSRNPSVAFPIFVILAEK